MEDNKENRLKFANYLEGEGIKRESWVRYYKQKTLDQPIKVKIKYMDVYVNTLIESIICKNLVEYNRNMSNY